MTPDSFDRLVSNDADKLRWIKEAVDQLKYYRGEKEKTDGTAQP